MLVWNHTSDFKSNSRYALVRFWNHTYDFRPNCTPLSSITIINCTRKPISQEPRSDECDIGFGYRGIAKIYFDCFRYCYTRNSTLNTSLCKPIRMQDFIQLCDSMQNWSFSQGFRWFFNRYAKNNVISWEANPQSWLFRIDSKYCHLTPASHMEVGCPGTWGL